MTPRRLLAGGRRAYTATAGSPRIVAVTTAAGIAGGGVAWLAGERSLASLAWAAVTALALVPLALGVIRNLLRREPGVDLIALLAMSVALGLGQALAGAVVALMLSSGLALESYADARARRELSALLARAPRTVRRHRGGELESVPVEEVRRGDLLLVGSGEVVPVDGVAPAAAVLDESALTGESRPVELRAGARVRSGGINAGGPFDLRAVTTAEESTYAGIVRLVREAQAARAPFVRLADRYALVFLPLTLVVAAGAWIVSGDPVRALAVLVVATPCPLILAAPVAIVAGISREARRGLIVKGGGALEALARARVVLLDKTGTLTAGTPRVSDVNVLGRLPADEVLRLAASLDQVSPHVFAPAIVAAAAARELPLCLPGEVEERPGAGISGTVEGHRVAVGRATWVAGGPLPATAEAVRRRTAADGTSNVFVAVDGALAGALVLEDPIRGDASRAVRELRRAGVRRIVVVTGDHPDVAALVGAAVGADAVLAEQTPAQKVEAVRRERAGGVTVMVGDGVNDAPALAAADVGVAMGARGATASSEAADVVMTVDRLDRLAEGIRIARRARTIALQSVVAGMSLSIVAMAAAAAGLLPPVAGAVLQEGIDVLVILNALRALTGSVDGGLHPEAHLPAGMGDRHRELLPVVDRVRQVADRLDELPAAEAAVELAELSRLLAERLLPHEAADDTELYPVVARVIGGADPTAPMSREHLEIRRLAAQLARIVGELPAGGPTAADLRDPRRVLYGLHAVLRLHFAQEDESYLSLFEPEIEPAENGRVSTRRR
jgi:heavy metal translocating P-type ATPase